GPTFLAPFARSAAPPQPSSRRPPTPKSCPCISKKSGTTSHRARTQPLFSTALDIISPPASPYPATSHLFTSRPTHPSSTRSKTSGNICAATSSPTRSTKITTISSKKAAKHGCSSPTTRSRSLQSPHANGQRSIFSAVGISRFIEVAVKPDQRKRPGLQSGQSLAEEAFDKDNLIIQQAIAVEIVFDLFKRYRQFRVLVKTIAIVGGVGLRIWPRQPFKGIGDINLSLIVPINRQHAEHQDAATTTPDAGFDEIVGND